MAPYKEPLTALMAAAKGGNTHLVKQLTKASGTATRERPCAAHMWLNPQRFNPRNSSRGAVDMLLPKNSRFKFEQQKEAAAEAHEGK